MPTGYEHRLAAQKVLVRENRPMRSKVLRGGLFEGPPRALYRRDPRRYFDVCLIGIVLNGVAVSGFGLIALALYLDLGGDDAALAGGAFALAFAVEGSLAAFLFARSVRPVRDWLAGKGAEEGSVKAWAAAATAPLTLVRRPALYALAALGSLAISLAIGSVLDRPAGEVALLVPLPLLLYLSSGVLRYVALEMAMRPVLASIGGHLEEHSLPRSARVTLHQRLLATVPMVTWGSSLIVAGLLTQNTRDLDTIAEASLIAVGVTVAVSLWLSFVLADSVSAPLVDLRDASRRIGSGDLSTRVPVVSTDETGELAAAFNGMAAGLGERARLREAFGTFVDPDLIERVLAEGSDLRGEEVDASILFLDVRDFTRFAERSAPREVVACLNRLYEVVVPVIDRHGGHANKFFGDGLLAVFGAPERRSDHATRAVAAALEIAGLVGEAAAGELRVGIGINSGPVVVGTIGGGERRDFTVIGDVVNTAARVEAATRETGDDVLITGSTLAELDATTGFDERLGIALKGKEHAVRLYAPVPPSPGRPASTAS